LLPVYFGYLAGEAMNNFEEKRIHLKLMMNAFAFVLGLTLLNMLLGFGAKAASDLLLKYTEHIRIAGGIMLLLFGLYFIFGLNMRFMEREHRVHYKRYTPSFLKSFILGITFSFGWTPCSGPILATILMMASFQKDYMGAGTLMIAYSMGFAIMFLLSALLVSFFVTKVRSVYKYFKQIKIGAGVIMIGMGILMLADKMHWLAL
jgi:cytochrome c biogenesis protein CcdA